MKTTASPDTLGAALASINNKYNGNILCKVMGTKGKWTTFRLGVKNSHGPGASYNPYSNRHTAAACWHAHGHFFDALLALDSAAIVKSNPPFGRGVHVTIDVNGGNWQDFDRGSMLRPLQTSECCHCDE